jgi:spermidine synthase
MNRDKVIFCLFFISGFCSLLYQVVWIRLAYASFGILTSVLSILISVFMLGLAVGSWAGGRWIAKLTARTGLSAIYFYALSEFLIGIGAFLVPFLFNRGEGLLLVMGSMDSANYIIGSALVIVLTTIPWCFFMGTTFPTMMAFIKENDFSQKTSFGFLYLANVLGAMSGTLVSALVMIELLGFWNTLLVAGCGNFTVAATGLLLGLRYPYKSAYDAETGTTSMAEEHQARIVSGTGAKKQIIYAILFTTGFTSMALEVIWFRAYTPVLKTQVYSFAFLLFTYLFSTSIGSFAYRRHLKNNSVWSTPALLGLIMMAVFLPVVVNAPRFNVSAVKVLASIAPFCGLLGYLTPKLIDEYSQGRPQSAGYAYALNVIGCILGPLFASYFLLPVLSSTQSMLVMGLPFFAFFAMHIRSMDLNRIWSVALTVLAGVLVAFSFFTSRSLEEQIAGKNGLVLRDHTATVIARHIGNKMELLVNGTHQGSKNLITKVMAHLPMTMLEREPKSALVICFGMGVTFRSLMNWKIQTTAVELVPSVIESFGYFYQDADNFMKHPDARIVIDDGRRFLRRTRDRFDVITLDPPWPPEAAGSSLLYSEEFYKLAKSRLAQDGILQQWYPGGEAKMLQAVVASIKKSFPYVKIFRGLYGFGFHFIASKTPMQTPTVDEFILRLPEAGRLDLIEMGALETTNKALRRLVSNILAVEMAPGELPDDPPPIYITDDKPFNEYFALRRFFGWYKTTTNPPLIRSLNQAEEAFVDTRIKSAKAFLDAYLDINASGDIRLETLAAALSNWRTDSQASKKSSVVVAYNLGSLFGQYINNILGTKWVRTHLKDDNARYQIRHNESGTMIEPTFELYKAIAKGDVSFFEKTYEQLENRIDHKKP